MKTIAISALVLAALASSANAAVVISNKATKNMSCASGVCTPTAKNAVLNAGDLEAMLAASDVTVTTGSGSVSIAISAALTWASASRLTLDSAHGVSVKAAVVSEGTGGLTVTLNDGGSGGELTFFPGGSIAFWDDASSLIIAGHAYTLVSDIATLASGVAANPAGFYALAKDYDASGDGQYADSPVPTTLTGTFEGLGHTVSNLNITPADTAGTNIGFFTEIDGTASAFSLAAGDVACSAYSSTSLGMFVSVNKGVLSGISVAGYVGCGEGSIGGVAGSNAGTISRASANVTLYGSGRYAGGIAGANSGTIATASVAGMLNGGYDARVGGVTGSNTGIISDAHSSAALNTEFGGNIGGIAGSSAGTVERCSSSGPVSAMSIAGGVVGLASAGLIDSSFATGTVIAGRSGGGVVGQAKGTTISNSYATGAVTGRGPKLNRDGGLAGQLTAGGMVRSSWSSGAVSGTVSGGLIGSISDEVSDSSYWDLDTSGISDPGKGAGNKPNAPGITGLTTAQFQSGLPAGFDPAIWAESPGINNGYPYLIANPPQ